MIIDRFRADGKVALVTGGTRGIGLGIARALAEAGADVIVSARTDPGGTEELRAEGHKVEYRPCDVTQPGAIDALVAGVARDRGRLDILVNNAGVAMHGPTEDFSDERYRGLMAVNLDSVYFACRAAIRPMRAQGGGVILNIGSISGHISNVPQIQTAYNASKAAVHMLTKSLASDLAKDNIRVNAIAPGYIMTDMTAGGFEIPEWAEVWTDMTPMRRAGTVEEIATAALLLCTDASSYMTGSVVVIDGGYTTR
ncbi:3-oxoacyl-[acyl-carrier protein] reductase [Rubellimicrobium mesophilum DSM 19309]|uniref:3-oxoacyl-[acyl-carrier protein] reductase n=1 Tax=Rubellimicrobium mesophilum DSM 19309 TaxID=442562 RepID=A0A017HS51_9RHOB|nr:SDR family oxidoreductase [Rubellimicrobium mesophilum]EYD77216.1 3-oxoacyl-[acyl-carrier protein] reductase [Rubellimicrobium mesophilum DSM 19309]